MKQKSCRPDVRDGAEVLSGGLTRRKVALSVLATASGVVANAEATSTAAGVTDSEIRLGASVVLSGPLGPQTADYGVGSRLYFEKVNAGGGVHGRRITYLTLDDAFDVKRAVENTKTLLQREKVFLLYQNTGTAHTAAILPLAEAAKAVVFGPVTGASVLRENTNRYLFHVRASYADEAAKIVLHLRQLGIRRIATFHQADAFGEALLKEAMKAAAAAEMQVVANVSVNPKQPDFESAATKLTASSPSAVVMCTAGGTFTDLVKAVLSTSARPTFYGFSVVTADHTTRALGAQARGIILAQIMPSLLDRANPAVNEFIALSKEGKKGEAPSQSQFEGFMHAKVLVEGLRRAGRNLDTEAFVRAMESAGELSIGKFSVKYSPRSHQGSSYVELAIIDHNGKLKY